jgi:hypothetical protein
MTEIKMSRKMVTEFRNHYDYKEHLFSQTEAELTDQLAKDQDSLVNKIDKEEGLSPGELCIKHLTEKDFSDILLIEVPSIHLVTVFDCINHIMQNFDPKVPVDK